MDKPILRRECMARRLALTPEERAYLSAQCRMRLCAMITARVPPCTVAGYVPIRGEVDILPALTRLQQSGFRIALPVTDADNLAFHYWNSGDSLLPGQYGIPHPPLTPDPITPDLVIVPLLAFDRDCRRLGYGKGYYDRALSALRVRNPGVFAVGAAFALQETAALPAQPHDEPLDSVVTEREILLP